MSTIITNAFRILNANKFKEQLVTDAAKNLYFFVGRPTPWTPDDNAPDAVKDSVLSNSQYRYDMVALKKLSASSISNAIPRFDWDASGNTVYVPYAAADSNLFVHPTQTELDDAIAGSYTAGSFYVLTDDYNVYICLSNNSGVKSTVKPTGTLANNGNAPATIETADGYIWKYLFTVSASEALRFATKDFIPVKNLTADDGSNQWQVQSNAVDGAIEHVKVTAGGTGYTKVFDGTLTSGGAGNNTFVLPAGASAVTSDYVNSTIYITSGTGSGQNGFITAYDGPSRAGTVSANWTVNPDGTSVVEVRPTVRIAGEGTGAKAKATVAGGVITKIAVTNRGSGYHSAVATILGGGGTGATAQPQVSPVGGLGSDMIKLLGGFFSIINTKLDYEETYFPRSNDYRRLGLIANIKDQGTNTISTASNLSATKVMSLNTIGPTNGLFLPDELITGDSVNAPKGKVVEFTQLTSTTGTLRYYQDESTGFDTFHVNEIIQGSTSSVAGNIASLTDRQINIHSGEILYVENRRAIVRDVNQQEELKLAIEW